MARRKQVALADVPQTTEDAIALLDEYRKVERASLADGIIADAVINETKKRLAECLAAREPLQKARFAALKAWWEAGGKDLAGKKRSAELAGATLGIRLTPPAVKFAKGWNGQKALEWLKTLRWMKASGFMRTKVELDKQAIIKAIGEPEVAKAFGKVLTVEQADEFFIDTGLDEAVIAAELGA